MNPGFQNKIRIASSERRYHPQVVEYLKSHKRFMLDDETLDKLVLQLRLGSKTVIDPIIKCHLWKGAFVVNKMAFRYSRHLDDLLGEMELAVTEATHSAILVLTNNNITPYLLTRVWTYLFQYIGKQTSCMRIPPRTLRHLQKKGVKVAEHDIPKQSATVQSDYSNQETDGGRVNSYIVPESEDDHFTNEEIEFIKWITPDFISQRIIELRVEGYTYEEIEPQVGYSKSAISLIVQGIANNYDKRKRYG